MKAWLPWAWVKQNDPKLKGVIYCRYANNFVLFTNNTVCDLEYLKQMDREGKKNEEGI